MGVSDNSEHDIPVIYANKAITKLVIIFPNQFSLFHLVIFKLSKLTHF